MFRRLFAPIFLVLILISACAQLSAADTELYRIRIRNKAGGLVQVSLDGGTSYATVGRVTNAANARIIGFSAASYTPGGAVAATAVHGIRIKTGQFANGIGKAQMPLMFSICPLEFARLPRGYGGHSPRSSGIHTDIYTGHSIFRNESPFVGSPVFVENDHALEPLPQDYTPMEGEVFVIVVNAPDKPLREVDMENKSRGKVVAKYRDGSSETVAEVVSPVLGVGRYDGTTFTGVGAINTNHGGVITISTAPTCLPRTVEGGDVETRGGFMIQPYYHVWEQGEASPQVMVIGPRDKSKPHLEGTPPLFDGDINLTRYPDSPEHGYRVQVKIDDGEWESVPKMLGKLDNAFTPAYLQSYFAGIGKPRQVSSGVTAVRILFPDYDPKLTARDVAREAADYTSRALASGVYARFGTLVLAPAKTPRQGSMVNFYVDGRHVYSCNEYPYQFKWDSTTAANGFHSIETETVLDSAAAPLLDSRNVLVKN